MPLNFGLCESIIKVLLLLSILILFVLKIERDKHQHVNVDDFVVVDRELKN